MGDLAFRIARFLLKRPMRVALTDHLTRVGSIRARVKPSRVQLAVSNRLRSWHLPPPPSAVADFFLDESVIASEGKPDYKPVRRGAPVASYFREAGAADES